MLLSGHRSGLGVVLIVARMQVWRYFHLQEENQMKRRYTCSSDCHRWGWQEDWACETKQVHWTTRMKKAEALYVACVSVASAAMRG